MQNQEKIFSKVELLTTLLVSGLFIILFNIDIFVRYLSGDGTASYNYFNDKLQEYINVPLDWLSDNLFTASITTFVLWGIFGVICYSVLYFFIDVESEVTETLEIGDTYMHPTYEKPETYKYLLLKNTLILLGTTVSIALVLILSFKVFIPYMSTNILLALYESDTLFSALKYVILGYISIVIVPISYIAIIKINRILRSKASV